MQDSFIFPFGFSDLKDRSSDDRYIVEGINFVKEQEEKQIKRTLNELDRAIYDNIHIIQDSDRFNYLYWISDYLDENKEKQNIEILEKASDVIHTHLSRVIKILNEIDGEDEINEYRVTFKMLIFLAFYFLSASCVKKPKKVLIANEIRGKKEQSPEFFERIAEKQANLLQLLEDSLLLNLKSLWIRREMDSQFYKYYFEVSLKIMESKQSSNKDSIKEKVFSILKRIIQQNPESSSTIQFKLINLIYEDESILQYLGDFLLSTQPKQRSLIKELQSSNQRGKQQQQQQQQQQLEAERDSAEKNFSQLCTDTLIRLVNYANQSNVNTESQAVKNVKEFLSRMSEKIPKIFYNNLSCFVQLLDNEAYHLRNAVVDIMVNIVKQVLSKSSDSNNLVNLSEADDADQDTNHEKAKEKILDALIQRIYDKNAFSRSHVLNALIELSSSNLIPQSYLQPLLESACDRIKDTSANVRRKAIVLLHKAIEYYYIVFVRSQNRTKFLSLEELDREISFNQAEKQDLLSEIKEIEASLSKSENAEQFDILHHDLNQVKRKLESSSKLHSHLEEYKKMITSIENVMPNLLQLLGSKNNTDAAETIRLMIYLHQTNISCSSQGIRKMLVLIWSKEKPVREELLKAYWTLYLDEKAFKAEGVAKNLVFLFKRANLTDLTSLEELLLYVQKWNETLEEKEKEKKSDLYYLSQKTFDKVWEIFTSSVIHANEPNSKYAMRAAFTVLRICSVNKSTEIFTNSRMLSLIEVLKKFLRLNTPDWVVVKEIGLLLETKEDCPYLNSFIKLMVFILIKFQGTQDNEWYCACEQILNSVFSLEENPESLIKYLILRCTKTLLEGSEDQNNITSKGLQIPNSPQRNINESISPLKVTPIKSMKPINNLIQREDVDDAKQLLFERRLGHLLFLVGHCGLKLLIHIDGIEGELKRLRVEGEKKQEMAQQKDGPEAAELDKMYGGLEAEYEKRLEYLHRITEDHVINGDNLVGQYKPWVDQIIGDIIRTENEESAGLRNPDLDRVAVLALCKFMCISKTYCEKNLPVLFQLLESPHSDYLLKINIIVSLGDLLHKYPNLVEPYNSRVFAKLHDPDVQVRKTTMMVLTHLILNDMMKIRGEICEVALLLEDEDPKIQNIVKLFLHELHKKDQKIIYNLLPEAIGRMSRQNKTELGAPIHEKTFENFAKNIMQYLEKDKYSETLVEKLCLRFSTSSNQREWRNVSYCLSQLSYNEKGLRKLIEFYESYREKLNDSEIMENFQNILIKLKRLPKQDMKLLIEEFEAKVAAFKTETFTQPTKRKEPGSNPGQKKERKRKEESIKENQRPSGTGINTAQAKKSKKQTKIESESEGERIEEEDFDEEEDEEIEVIKPQVSRSRRQIIPPKVYQPQNVRQSQRKKTQSYKRNMQIEDEDEDMDEEVISSQGDDDDDEDEDFD